MKEEFLHFIWKHQLCQKESLFTTEGDSLQISQPGFHNTHAGPDFF